MRRTEEWIPKTALGKMVVRGEVTSMGQALRTGLALREPEIVNLLLPELEDEVLDVNMVQRMTDSGRRINFAITVVIGNGDGYVGLGRTRGKEVGPMIRKAFEIGKLNIIEIKRGCGSWECGCLTPHTLPFKVTGKSGSVEVTLKPAPRGVGLAVADIPKSVLRLAGIKDVWGFSRGHTKTTVNYAYATFEALKQTMEFKISEGQMKALRILSGPSVPVEVDLTPTPEEEPEPAVEVVEVSAESKPPEGETEAAPAPKAEGETGDTDDSKPKPPEGET